jgi:hypothetical protein
MRTTSPAGEVRASNADRSLSANLEPSFRTEDEIIDHGRWKTIVTRDELPLGTANKVVWD